jgi:hypothetical protein
MNPRVHALVNATFVQRMAFAIDRGFFATWYKSRTRFTSTGPHHAAGPRRNQF